VWAKADERRPKRVEEGRAGRQALRFVLVPQLY
jgi:hypothetical protein